MTMSMLEFYNQPWNCTVFNSKNTYGLVPLLSKPSLSFPYPSQSIGHVFNSLFLCLDNRECAFIYGINAAAAISKTMEDCVSGEIRDCSFERFGKLLHNEEHCPNDMVTLSRMVSDVGSRMSGAAVLLLLKGVSTFFFFESLNLKYSVCCYIYIQTAREAESLTARTASGRQFR